MSSFQYLQYGKACKTRNLSIAFIVTEKSLAGKIRKSDPGNHNPLLSKNLDGVRFHASDTVQTGKHRATCFRGLHYLMGLSRDICTAVPM